MTGRPAIGRPLLAGGVGLGAALALVPRDLPRAGPLTPPATVGLDLAVFGVRLLLAGLAAYVGLVLLLAALAALPGTPARLRRALVGWGAAGLAGRARRLVGISTLSLGLTTLAAPPVAADPAPVLRPAPAAAPGPTLDGPPPVLAPSVPAPSAPTTPPTVAPVPTPPRSPDRPAPALAPEPPPERPPDPATPADTSAPRSSPTAGTERTVAPGDSFWSIAEEEVSRRLGRPATTVETAAWWVRLIEANRDRLVDPIDPDLLLPGQRLLLPPFR